MNRKMNRFMVLAVTLLTAGGTWAQVNLPSNESFEGSFPFFGWTRFGAENASGLLQDHAKDQEINTDGNGLTPFSTAAQWLPNERIVMAPENAEFACIVLLHMYVGNEHHSGSYWFDQFVFQ